VRKVFTAILVTGNESVALLLPVFAAGSLPPDTVAVLVTLGTALLPTVTLIAIGFPILPLATTVELVQVTV
jgi:hypothetical protein